MLICSVMAYPSTHRLFEHLQLGSPATVYSHIRHIKREIMAVFEKELYRANAY